MYGKRPNWGRRLRTEQLEKRDLLAADLGSCVAVLPDASEIAIVAVNETPPQQQERSQEDNETGSGIQQRPRDRDSEDAMVAAMSVEAAGAGTETPLQQRTRGQEDNENGQGDLLRQRDRDCTDAALVAIATEAAGAGTETPLQERARSQEDNENGQGDLLRQRDRDSE